MDKLLSGIKIYDGNITTLANPRISLNSGTIAASKVTTPNQSYSNDARLPKSDWRVPTTDECTCLMTSTIPTMTTNWVSVIRLPDDVLMPFDGFRAATKAKSEKTLFELKESPSCQHGTLQVSEFVTTLNDGLLQPLEGIGISVRLPNLITGTFDYKSNHFIGMHLDSWYRYPLQERHHSPNRICINLGQEDRYLLFINLPMQAIFELIDDDKPIDPSTLGRLFMQRFPDYPVIRLRIGPKEAYIAPTENIIHDGSTLGQKYFDVCLTIRGQFKASFINLT